MAKKNNAQDLIIAIEAVTMDQGVDRYLLLVDRQTRFNLAADPIPLRYRNKRDLVSSLIARGAVWNDAYDAGGALLPAMQAFNKAGQCLFLCHYREGTRQDPAPGIYAEQYFRNNGKAYSSCSYDEHKEYGSARRAKVTAPSRMPTPALPDWLAGFVRNDLKPAL